MANTDISIVNQALLITGAEQITSFDDTSREAEVASALYETAKNALLSRHPWTFALGQASLAQIVSTPLFGFTKAYQLPTDPKMIKLIRKNSPKNDDRVFEDKLYTDDNTVEIVYLFDPGEGDFPDYFSTALVMELAVLFAASLIQSETLTELYTKLALNKLKVARNIDSQQQPSIRIDASEFSISSVR